MSKRQKARTAPPGPYSVLLAEVSRELHLRTAKLACRRGAVNVVPKNWHCLDFRSRFLHSNYHHSYYDDQ